MDQPCITMNYVLQRCKAIGNKQVYALANKSHLTYKWGCFKAPCPHFPSLSPCSLSFPDNGTLVLTFFIPESSQRIGKALKRGGDCASRFSQENGKIDYHYHYHHHHHQHRYRLSSRRFDDYIL
ncbi:hypothetical protein SAY87_017098 [Trapa incisa]|uniref:Uncharacterized protein n=1 Tax=Trapa incisa TaxID=236973 RepID=A0AAN7QVW2_9MYRT|nr:hypothetical protein SAY87_017098 [Trapa incisa]